MGGVLMLRYVLMGIGATAACAPRYAELGPMAPEELWAPGEVQHVEVDGVDIAYIDEGMIDAPPVVLLHGLSSWMGFWEHQVPALSEHHRVLALDLPGYGASGRPDAPFSPPWYADLVVRWLDALEVDRAVFVGHSMGGQVALTLALRHPDRVERLVLSAPAGFERFRPGAAQWMKTFWTEDRALHATEDELRGTFTQAVFNRRTPGVERLLEERVRMQSHPSFRGTSLAVSRCIAGMIDFPVFERLPEVGQPTLVVFGTEDHMIPNPVFNGGRTATIAASGVERLPDARLVLLRGAGHTVHFDDPEGFNKAMLDFLGGSR
jgi:pimeloyl-ACP methyl ester carboxylesterase